jgi:hypothetical protein
LLLPLLIYFNISILAQKNLNFAKKWQDFNLSNQLSRDQWVTIKSEISQENLDRVKWLSFDRLVTILQSRVKKWERVKVLIITNWLSQK